MHPKTPLYPVLPPQLRDALDAMHDAARNDNDPHDIDALSIYIRTAILASPTKPAGDLHALTEALAYALAALTSEAVRRACALSVAIDALAVADELRPADPRGLPVHGDPLSPIVAAHLAPPSPAERTN